MRRRVQVAFNGPGLRSTERPHVIRCSGAHYPSLTGGAMAEGSSTAQWDAALPEAARARMAEIRQSKTWGSALSTQEFAAIEGAGFDPVGQVLGTAVFHIGYAGRWG